MVQVRGPWGAACVWEFAVFGLWGESALGWVSSVEEAGLVQGVDMGWKWAG